MALRLLEILTPSERLAAVRGVLDGHAPLGLWVDVIEGEMSLVRVLVDAAETETLIDELEVAGAGRPEFRLILLPVEATLPRPPEAEKKPDEAADEKSRPARARRARVSREELYAQISETTRSLPVFVAMTVLSAVVAALGIHLQNTAAIVGAMVIAPLLGPNMALALATTLGDLSLARRAITVNLLGLVIVLGLGFLLGVLIDVDPGNRELLARSQITLADVALALASGVAGALAFTSGVSSVLIGVMVAVALVPPTVTLALVAGAGEWTLARGAALLLIANIICINLAAVGTFLAQGVHPAAWWKRDRARRTAWIAVAAWILLLAILVLVIGFASGCGRSETPAPSGGEPGADAGTPAGRADGAEAPDVVRLRNVGLARIEAEQHAEATKVFEQLAARLPDEPMVHANLGLIALREGDLATAREHLATAARLAPGDPATALLQAQAATLDGREDEALAALRAAVAQHPGTVRGRWAIIEILRRQRNADDVTRAELRSHLETLLDVVPENVVARLALARTLVESADLDAATRQLAVLGTQGVVADGQPKELLDQARAHLEAGNAGAARSAVIGLDNVMKPTRAWQGSLLEVAGPPVQVGEPVWDFAASAITEPAVGPRAAPVTYAVAGEPGPAGAADLAIVLPAGGATRPSLVAARGSRVLVYPPDETGAYPPAGDAIALTGEHGDVDRLLALDWTNDRSMDLVAALADGSVWMWASAPAPGAETAGPALAPADGARVRLLLPWDFDQDGDLDLLVGRTRAALALLRNNGDGTWAEVAAEHGLAEAGAPAVVAAVTFDLDEDGDGDLLAVDETGAIEAFLNERSGRFVRTDVEIAARDVADVAAADLDNDGWLDLILLGTGGSCRVAGNLGGAGFAPPVLAAPVGDRGAASIATLDFDLDGWMDILHVAGGRAELLRNTGGLTFAPAVDTLPAGAETVRSVEPFDRDHDGDLDLLVLRSNGTIAVWDHAGVAGHGWQTVELEAILQGSQKNPSFGVGGRIEIRAGRSYQKRIVQGPVTHFGLGQAGPVDAIRVIWPNGVPQNTVLPEPDSLVVEKQTLKGSCPFLFAFDGESKKFVTDLLWRSPLGMKINAQTVALTGATRDYVKIEASQLQPRDGRYDMTITAALWETIFFDEITLLAVDRPADIELFLDERFVAPSFPGADLTVVEELRTPVTAVDHRGRDVLDLVARRDRRRLGGFERSGYQGIAEPHFVELDLGAFATDAPVRVLASGWIMPTDTSINVAMGQGEHPRPEPLSVAVADGAGGWRTVIPNAGFPSGKLKTVVLDLTGQFPTADHRVRIATNLEIYWDRLAFTVGTPAFAPSAVPLERLAADFQPVGFPEMTRRDDIAPEIPDYSAPSYAPRWRDLHGYYTRYGAIGPLLDETDDRYVIMNAGDGIHLSFDAGPPPPAGWERDFILVTDGWVKDGDWNTVDSKTVAPLPFHGMTSYPYPADEAPPEVRPDHPDWLEYHTRYVTSEPFRDRLKP